MNKKVALILSVITGLFVLLLVNYLWVVIKADGAVFKALGVGVAYFTGKYLYEFLKKKQ